MDTAATLLSTCCLRGEQKKEQHTASTGVKLVLKLKYSVSIIDTFDNTTTD